MTEKEMLLNLLKAADRYREAEKRYYNCSYIDKKEYLQSLSELDNLLNDYKQLIKP